MPKNNKLVPIKVKLLSIIIPTVLMIMVVLIGISYAISKQTILKSKSSSNFLASSIENQSNEIEAWLNENLSAFQMAKDLIETINPDEEELQVILDSYYGKNDNCTDGLYIADEKGNLMMASGSSLKEG